MKKSRFGTIRILLIVLLSVVAILALVGFVACSGDDEDNSESRQVPVYQGMVVSSVDMTGMSGDVQSYAADNTAFDDDKLFGDIVGREDLIDEDNPFGDGSFSIEQEIQGEFGIVGTGRDIYYADQNEDILITVKFSNPNNFEIMSFVINGQTYANYMFQDGSDMENIIIKLNVGSDVGFNKYEISEIKYIDGTEIKDVILNGDTVVTCGVRGDGTGVEVSVMDESVTLDTISFDAKVSDNYSIIVESGGYAMAVLYDGVKILDSVDLNIGNNEVEFVGLNPNTLYQYAVVVVYDDLSGNGLVASYPYKNSVYTETFVLFDDVEVTKTGISFGFSWYEGYDDSCLTSVTLVSGLQRTVIDISSREISGLLSDNEYTLIATYEGFYDVSESIRLTFTTLAMDMPEIVIDVETTHDSFSYTISVEDDDTVMETITSIIVYQGDQVLYTGLDTAMMFENLLSGYDFDIVVTYTYDLNDGLGVQTAELTKAISTVAVKVPTVDISVVDSSGDEITFCVNYTDEDNAGSVTSVVLYSGNEVVKTEYTYADEMTFSGLTSYTQYTLVIYYTYDLNDGVGTRSETAELSVYTDPVIEFVAVGILNTEAVSEGDAINIWATMNSSVGMRYTSVVINGISYDVSAISTSENLYVAVVSNGQFAGGETALTITQITGTFNGDEFTVDITENNVATVFINGELYVDNFSVVAFDENGDEEERQYKFKDETLYFKIELMNATGYDIDSVTIGGTVYSGEQIILSEDKQAAYVALTSNGTGWHTYSLSGISYKNDSTIEKSRGVDMSAMFVGLSTASGEYVEIKTVDDLKNMSGWEYYKLMNDIDLAGESWINVGNSMKGVFDGGGHRIYNITGGATYNDENVYLGLFESVEGIVMHLEIYDEVYMVTLSSTINNSYDVYAGGLAVTSNHMIVVDCIITASFDITNETGGTIYIGAISAYPSNAATLDAVVCNFKGDITCNYYYYNGYYGRSERIGSGSFAVTDSTCNGTISVSDFKVTEEYIQSDDFIFRYEDGVYTLVNYVGYEECVVLPDSINGNPYELGERLFDYSPEKNVQVKEVVFSSGVTSIGDYCFQDCTTLTSVVLSDSVTSIGRLAFMNCSSLTSIVFTNGLTTIEDSAFENCGSLTEVVIPGSVTSMGGTIFWGCASLESVVFEYGVTTTGNSMFSDCNSLTNVTMPGSMTTIASDTFANCTSLTSITIPYGVTTIGSNAFSYCTSLTSITIPGSVTEIYDAFNGCTSLTTIILEYGMETISNGAFANCTSLMSITIPDSVVRIDGNAFAYCTSLTSIIIPDGVTNIGDFAFAYCTSLTSIIIPDSVENIENSAFRGCTSLTSAVLGNGLRFLQNALFADCTALTTVVIPNSIADIEDNVFENCTSLTALYYLGSASEWSRVNKMGNSEFYMSVTVYCYSESAPTDNGYYWHYVDGVPTPWRYAN